MKRKIPSTKGLIVFESAARHESFSHAAKELNLTDSAVSRQMTSLQAFLGVKLFLRVNRRTTLSETGRIYVEQIRRMLDQIERTTTSLTTFRADTYVLELAAIPTFTTKWLMPRLKSFRDLHPGITVNISERIEPFSLGEANFDAAIHYDHPGWAGMKQVKLFSEELVPVINPQAFDVARMGSPADLARVPLLHNANRLDAWERWFQRAGVANVKPCQGGRFDLYSHVIAAVIAGLGVGLVPRIYVVDELRSGKLVTPFRETLPNEKTYCIVYPAQKEACEPLRRFTDWMVARVAEFQIHTNHS